MSPSKPEPKPRVVVPPARPVAMKEIQLIDRVEEMNLLREAADRAVHGEGGVIFLYGEAGIGKTRLARELGGYARSRGMQVLSGRCPALFRMDGVPPYVLWKEVIKDYLEACPPEQLHRVIGFYPIEVSKLVPELKQKLRTLPESFPLNPEHSRDRLFEAVSQFITNISREAPLLVILDDLQWTDQSSLLLLHYLARGVYKESMLLLGAYRDTYVDDHHPLSPVLTELNRERLLQSVPLKRISFDDVSEMIKRILEQDDVSTEFCELVYEKTRGNPFFVEEVIKSLEEDEVIYREKNKWKIKEVSRIEFPKTVKSVLKKRISRLDDESQYMLTMASFVGKDFTFEALGGVTGIEENRLLEIVDKMLKTGLFKHSMIRGEDVCSFADIMVRDVVHDEVNPFRHKKLHGVVGDALEKVYAKKKDEHLGELAYHFLESGDKGKALDYFLKAGERAQRVYAHDEAFSYLQHAFELLEEKEDNVEEKARLIERLGELNQWMGKRDASVEYLNKSLKLWDQLGYKKNIARLHAKMASWIWQFTGDRERASKHHRMALEILEKEPASVELASLYEDISHMLWRSGSAEALPLARKAFKLADTLDDSEILAGCYNNLGTLYLKLGEFEKAAKHYEQGLKIALENNVPPAVALYNNLSELYRATAEFQKMFETAQKGSEFSKKVGSLYGLSWIDSVLAASYMYRGELQKSVSIYEDILALAKRIKYPVQISGAMCGLAWCYQFLGEWEKSTQFLMEARNIAEKIGEYQFSGLATLLLGELFMEQEDYVEAEKYFKESSNIYQNAKEITTLLIGVFPDLSRLYLKKGEIEKAEELIEKIYEEASRTKNRLVTPNAEMLQAMLFREQRKWEQSIQHFEKSLQGYKSLNAQEWYVPQFAELLYEYGSMYLSRNEEGDKEKAYSLLNQALEIYQKMGAQRKIKKTKARMIYVKTGREIVKPEPVTVEVSEIGNQITTGYRDLDNLLSGGIPINYAVILTAPSCDERDLLIRRFLEAGAREKEVTFYITTKVTGAKKLLDESQQDLYLFICNPQANTIIKNQPNIFKLKGVENLTDISIALASAFRKLDASPKGPRRACIEIVSDVLLQHHAVQTRRWLNALIPQLKSKGFTTLAVMDPQMHPKEEVRAILDLFEGEINIYEKETKRGSEKILKIKKMYNQRYAESELRLIKEKLQI